MMSKAINLTRLLLMLAVLGLHIGLHSAHANGKETSFDQLIEDFNTAKTIGQLPESARVQSVLSAFKSESDSLQASKRNSLVKIEKQLFNLEQTKKKV